MLLLFQSFVQRPLLLTDLLEDQLDSVKVQSLITVNRNQQTTKQTLNIHIPHSLMSPMSAASHLSLQQIQMLGHITPGLELSSVLLFQSRKNRKHMMNWFRWRIHFDRLSPWFVLYLLKLFIHIIKCINLITDHTNYTEL